MRTPVSLTLRSVLLWALCLAPVVAPWERSSAAEATPFQPGEVLQFALKWEFVTGGRAVMEVRQDPADSTAWQIQSRAWSVGIVDVFYTVRDTLLSVIDRDTLWPRRYVKRQHEGSYHRDSTYVFDQERRVVFNGRTEIACSTRVHDILSSLYRFRTLTMEPGLVHQINVYEGGKYYPLEAHVLRREPIDVAAGSFDCVVVEPVLRSDAIFKQRGRIWIWFTDDERRIPVLMKSEVVVGEIAAELERYSPGAGGSASTAP